MEPEANELIRPPLPAAVAGFLLTFLLLFIPLNLFADDLSAIRREAENEYDRFMRDITAMKCNLDVRPEGGFPDFGTYLRKGDKSRVEFREDGSADYAEICDGRNSYVWFFYDHILKCVTYKGFPQHRKFRRWFDIVPIVLREARLLGEANVGGKRCYLIEIPTSEVDGESVYTFRGIQDPDFFINALKLIGLSVPSRTGAASKVQANEKMPILSRFSPYSGSYGINDTDPPPAVRFINLFKVFTRIWVDKKTLSLVKIEGKQTFSNRLGESTASITWSNFMLIEGNHEIPLTNEVHIDGSLCNSSYILTFDINENVPDHLFDPALAHAEFERRIQQKARENIVRASTDLTQYLVGIGYSVLPSRDETLLPDAVVDKLGLTRGETVADIGAGLGYLTFRLAEAVGPSGRIHAVEIDPTLIGLIRARSGDIILNPYQNITCVKSGFDRTGIEDNFLDAALLCDVGFYRYAELDEINELMLESIFRSLKPGGRILVVEETGYFLNRNSAVSDGWTLMEIGRTNPTVNADAKVPSVADSGTRDVIISNFEATGFDLVEIFDLGDFNHYLMFMKPTG